MLTWLIIMLLLGATVFAAIKRYSTVVFLTFWLAVWLIINEFDDPAWWVTLTFWITFLVALAMHFVPRVKLWRVTCAAFGVSAVALLFGAVVATPVMTVQTEQVALTLPGGAIQKLAVLSSIRMSDVPPAQTEQDCPKDVRYYAYEAQEGTHNFGPVVEVSDVSAGAQRFATKAYCDPLWLAITKHYIAEGTKLDQSAVQAEAQTYVNDHNLWQRAINWVYGKIKKFSLVDAGAVKYDSLGMLPGANPSVMPTLTKFHTQPALGKALVAELDDGTLRRFRVLCDLQAAELFFSSVPAAEKPEVPPTQPPKTLTPPPSTTTPSTPSTPSTPKTTTPVTSTTTTPETTTQTTSTTPSTSTTTPSTSTSTTTTPVTSTTTTPSTTTTTPVTTTETTPTKGSVPYPTGKPPVSSPPSEPESTATRETNPAGTSVKPSGVDAPEATSLPTRTVPSQEPGSGSTPEQPGTGDHDPDGNGNALAAFFAIPAMLTAGAFRKKMAAKK